MRWFYRNVWEEAFSSDLEMIKFQSLGYNDVHNGTLIEITLVVISFLNSYYSLFSPFFQLAIDASLNIEVLWLGDGFSSLSSLFSSIFLSFSFSFFFLLSVIIYIYTKSFPPTRKEKTRRYLNLDRQKNPRNIYFSLSGKSLFLWWDWTFELLSQNHQSVKPCSFSKQEKWGRDLNDKSSWWASLIAYVEWKENKRTTCRDRVQALEMISRDWTYFWFFQVVPEFFCFILHLSSKSSHRNEFANTNFMFIDHCRSPRSTNLSSKSSLRQLPSTRVSSSIVSRNVNLPNTMYVAQILFLQSIPNSLSSWLILLSVPVHRTRTICLFKIFVIKHYNRHYWV